MLDRLLTEQRLHASRDIDTLPAEALLRVINDQDRTVADAVAAEIPAIARALEAIVARLERRGKLFYVGAGTSGRLGVLDASECPPTYNVPPELVQGVIAGGDAALVRATEASEDDPELGRRDLESRGLSGSDAVCGIAASGRTPYVLGAIQHARSLGAATIGIACVPDAELSRLVEFPIALVTGPEIVTGSTRMKAGTATKLVLNMLSTGALVRLGYVYSNLMVNVQPRNEKLVDRARRIVAEITGVSYEEAAAVLEAAGNDVRTAVLMQRLQLDRDSAAVRLREAGGQLRKALGER